MTYLQAVLLGALQGVTEFLPVSSSGHLVVLRQFMQLQDVPLLFDVILHVATLFVVLIIFRDRIGRIILSLLRVLALSKKEEDGENVRLFGIILVSTLITGVLGLGIESLEVGSHIRFVSVFFVLTGVILWVTRYTNGTINYGTIGIKQGLAAGFAQGLGVFPGISRSGITISAALLSGMNREKAGEYSFLISVPAILGALVLELKDLDALFVSMSPLKIAAGFGTAFAVGLLSLMLLLNIIKKGRLYLFTFYLVPLGIFGFFFF